MYHYWLWLLLIVTSFGPTFAQSVADFEVAALIHRPYTALSVAEGMLPHAVTIAELRAQYPADWVRTYHGVAITTRYDGRAETHRAANDTITAAQRRALLRADAGAPIHVAVTYSPANNLRDNPVRTFDFTTAVEPTTPARLIGGPVALRRYLQSRVLDRLPDSTFRAYQLAAVRFVVDAEGCVSAAAVLESTGTPVADAQLLAAVRATPDWQAATYADGTRVPVELVLSVGDLRSCTANLVGLPPPAE